MAGWVGSVFIDKLSLWDQVTCKLAVKKATTPRAAIHDITSQMKSAQNEQSRPKIRNAILKLDDDPITLQSLKFHDPATFSFSPLSYERFEHADTSLCCHTDIHTYM